MLVKWSAFPQLESSTMLYLISCLNLTALANVLNLFLFLSLFFFFTFADPSLTALVSEVEALRAALLEREQQVESLTRPMPLPVHPQFTTSDVPTTPGLVHPQTFVPQITTSGLVTSPGLMPSHTNLPQFTTSGVPTTPGLVHLQTYVPQITTSGLVTSPGLKPSHTYLPRFTTSSLPTTPGLVTTQTYVPRVVPAVTEGALNWTSSTRAIPAVSTLVTSSGGLDSPAQIHHHHYFTNKSGRGMISLHMA